MEKINGEITMKLYYKIRYYLWLKKKKKKNKTIFLLGTPVHENIGDAAIAYAELKYLKDILPRDYNVVEINQKTMMEYLDVLPYVIDRNSLILMHGGGNMGDEWIKEEADRRKVMSVFKDNRMIILPQTIYYKSPEKLYESGVYYSQFPNLSIIAREKESFVILKKYYKNRVVLTPDLVLYLKNKVIVKQCPNRKGCLLCFRNDNEILMSNVQKDEIVRALEDKKIPFKYTDMISNTTIYPDEREIVITNKIKEFASAQLVVTDRLHGLVFCYLANTPCVVFSNYNHKVLGTYEWINKCKFLWHGQENIYYDLSNLLSGLENTKFYQENLIDEELFKPIQKLILEKR